jgi:hypothetical protein
VTYYDPITGVGAGTLTFSNIENVICFTPGTLVATVRGLRAVERLSIGDLVLTRDNGPQPIRWIGSRTVPAYGKYAPVRIGKRALLGLQRDLIVSPQHRMLFSGYQAELLFGCREVLAAAINLVDDTAITRQEGGMVTYIHLLFDQHEIITAHGALTESLHTGDGALAGLSAASRAELFNLFPALRSDPAGYGATARRVLKQHEARLIPLAGRGG